MVFDGVDVQFVKNDGQIAVILWDIVHKSQNDCSFGGGIFHTILNAISYL